MRIDNKKELVPQLERIVGQYPGASFEVERRSGHSRVYLTYCDKRRFVTVSSTSGDPRALKNQMRDVRHALHQMEN